ncbi:MAG: membrane protein insertion efficiency factor YidD [Clostridia bacterium]|nr:membrane protein insertion efficiency factor YidD [Clostridia bacterium]
MKIIRIITYPFELIFLGLVYFYKICISPLLPKGCRFTPTCSIYMVQAIKEFGIFKGTYLGIKRIVRCGPGSKGGFDPIPENIKGEIKWLL